MSEVRRVKSESKHPHSRSGAACGDVESGQESEACQPSAVVEPNQTSAASSEVLKETLTHRLVLPRDANHYGTLYAGTLLALALEAGYSTAYHAAGANANLVLKRVLDLRCFEPVPVGEVIAIRGAEVFRARAQVVVALYGQPIGTHAKPWMDGLMQFVQVDPSGRPEPLEDEPPVEPPILPAPWQDLRSRVQKLLAMRH